MSKRPWNGLWDPGVVVMVDMDTPTSGPPSGTPQEQELKHQLFLADLRTISVLIKQRSAEEKLRAAEQMNSSLAAERTSACGRAAQLQKAAQDWKARWVSAEAANAELARRVSKQAEHTLALRDRELKEANDRIRCQEENIKFLQDKLANNGTTGCPPGQAERITATELSKAFWPEFTPATVQLIRGAEIAQLERDLKDLRQNYVRAVSDRDCYQAANSINEKTILQRNQTISELTNRVQSLEQEVRRHKLDAIQTRGLSRSPKDIADLKWFETELAHVRESRRQVEEKNAQLRSCLQEYDNLLGVRLGEDRRAVVEQMKEKISEQDAELWRLTEQNRQQRGTIAGQATRILDLGCEKETLKGSLAQLRESYEYCGVRINELYKHRAALREEVTHVRDLLDELCVWMRTDQTRAYNELRRRVDLSEALIAA